MKKIYSGYLELDDYDYTFYLNGTQLKLVACETKNIRHLNAYEEHKYGVLKGQLLDLHQIYLLNVKLYTGIFGYDITGTAEAIVFGAGNTTNNIEIEPINAISFTGDAVNRFYNPVRIVDKEKTKTDYDDFSRTVSLISPNDTLEKYQAKILEKVFNVSLFVGWNDTLSSSNNNIGSINSSFRLEATDSITIDKLLEIYYRVLDLFRFLSFRRNIVFDKITLLRKNEEGKYQRVANLILLYEQEKTEVDNFRTVIYEYIQGSLPNLIQNICTSDNYTIFIPKNDKEAKFVDFNSYLLTSASFEYFFGKVIKEQTSDVKIQNIKENVFAELNKYLEQTPSVDELISLVSDWDANKKTLKNQFKDVLRIKKDIINFVFPRLDLRSDSLDDISNEFAQQRNALAHGGIDKIKGLNGTPYAIALCLLYALILEESGVQKESIKKIVRDVFCIYTVSDKNE